MTRILGIFPLGFGCWFAGCSLMAWRDVFHPDHFDGFTERWISGGMGMMTGCVALLLLLMALCIFGGCAEPCEKGDDL